MHFQDQGLIIAKRPFKEKSSIVTIFSKNHGIYSGVLNQYNKKVGDNFLEGNLVDFSWKARLHEHIGFIKGELIKSYYTSIISNKTNLYSFNSIASILKIAFCEREPHNNLFLSTISFIKSLKNNFSFYEYIKLELDILSESGYRLQLERCAVTNQKEDLYYVSPKSGKAVSKSAGLEYANKLLILPQFLINNNTPTEQDKKNALLLTSYFFNRYIFQNKPQPEARQRFLELFLTINHLNLK